MRGGKYIAEERGAFECDEAATPALTVESEVGTQPATAPLFEVAAAHDGQPAMVWLRMFYRYVGAR